MHTGPMVVAATHAEIAPSIPVLEKHNIPYLITGVGMVATAHGLTRALCAHSVTYILNVGIAGSFSKELELGSLVEVARDSLVELGAEDRGQFRTIEELGFGRSCWNAHSVNGLDTGLTKVDGITVNTVHGNKESIEQILTRYPGIMTESMEGAAVFYVCAEEEMPCLQVRAISNYVEPRDRNRWNIPLAVQNLNAWLMEFLSVAYPDK